MKIKLDENMPTRLVRVLGQLGHDVDTVTEQALRGRDDATVWKAAQASGRLVITQDLHFSDIRDFVPGTHYGILLVRLRKPGRDALLARVEALFQTSDVDSLPGSLTVLTENKLRIRRP